MLGVGRGRGGRGGNGHGGGNGRGVGRNSTSGRVERSSQQQQPQTSLLQPPASSETGQSHHRQGSSTELQSSVIHVDTVHPTSESENNGPASCDTSKKRRGRYKSLHVDMQTKHGSKIKITIPDDMERAVGPGARDFVNYCGFIMRHTISVREGNWDEIITKHGDAMLLKIKDKFEAPQGREHMLQSLVFNTMQRLLRTWKTRLHVEYSRYTTDEERLSHRLDNVTVEDWMFLVELFGSPEYKAMSERNKLNRAKQITKHSCGSKSFAEVEESTRDSNSGIKATVNRVWELQHCKKNDKGELVWSDPQSQQIHMQLQEIVQQQQSEEIENPMTSDEILASVLGERTGYVRGKGYGKRPTKKKVVCNR